MTTGSATSATMSKNPAAVALGRIKSKKKAAAARFNGMKGGRQYTDFLKNTIKNTLYKTPSDPTHTSSDINYRLITRLAKEIRKAAAERGINL